MFKPLVSTRDLPDGLRDLYFLWDGAHAQGRPPSLTRLGLHQRPERLDTLVVTEILRGADGHATDFEFLYIGRTLNGALRPEQTGRRISDHPQKGPGSLIWAAYMDIAREPRPLVVNLPYIGPDPRFGATVELFLPLLDDHGAPRFVLVGVTLLPATQRVEQTRPGTTVG